MSKTLLVLTSLALLTGACRPVPTEQQPLKSQLVEPPEGMPPARWAQIEKYNEALSKTARVGSMQPEAVVAVAKRWAPGNTIRVAFRGGTPQIHRGIERVAAVWTQYANVGFDFGYDSSANRYRAWSTTDAERVAEIRIGFDLPGYWSCVGNDSMLDACATAGQQSMNLQRFDVALPSDWISTTLHEFGHSLGLEHEHQNPIDGCDDQFLWDDEPGYQKTRDMFQQFIPDGNGRRPGIFTVLAGPLNNWDRPTIERNMKELKNSTAYQSTQFDKDSIMKYWFPAWQFKDGERSKCYSARNDTLSTLDRVGIANAYPREIALIREAHRGQISALSAVKSVPELNISTQRTIQQQIDRLRDAAVMKIP
jgi:hypothetical protein